MSYQIDTEAFSGDGKPLQVQCQVPRDDKTSEGRGFWHRRRAEGTAPHCGDSSATRLRVSDAFLESGGFSYYSRMKRKSSAPTERFHHTHQGPGPRDNKSHDEHLKGPFQMQSPTHKIHLPAPLAAAGCHLCSSWAVGKQHFQLVCRKEQGGSGREQKTL